MIVSVVWLDRGRWDQALLADLLDRRAWRPVGALTYHHVDAIDQVPAGEGAVVVVPGGDVQQLQEQLARLPWALVIATSDEERHLPWWDLAHPNLAVWVQYPSPEDDHDADGFLPVGYTTGTPDVAAAASGPTRWHRWGFAGQVTHPRREQLVRVLADDIADDLDDGVLYPTDRFAGGLDHDAYLALLAECQVAPCPGGPQSPDTFRVWEALEAGCVPVVDQHAGERNVAGYWNLVLRGVPAPPFPFVDSWSELPTWLAKITGVGWPLWAASAGAWWIGYKRHLAYALDAQVRQLVTAALDADAGVAWDEGQPTLADLITVVVPTSPVPANPSLSHLLATLHSVADSGLGACEVIVTCDGVRAEQHHLATGYHQALQLLVTEAMHQWPNVLPVVHLGHQHQARMMRHALDLVRTPLVLYVEHDTPLDGPIDWWGLVRATQAGHTDAPANLVRLHWADQVLPEHRYLMPTKAPEDVDGVRLWRCRQWSQRPHLARTDYYRRIIAEHFEPEERWMIEDRMHGVLQNDRWDRHRVWLYAEPDVGGSIRRSLHLDARGDEPKWHDR